MQEYYKIYFPYSKEHLLDQIKKTTRPLCFSNQAYRDMALAAYKEEDDTLCIGYAAGSMTGGGWEMLQTHVKSYGGRCNAGRYVCAFAIHKKSCTIFPAHSDSICIVFFSGRFIDFNRMSDFIYVSIISAV